MNLAYLLYQVLGGLALPLAAPLVAVRAARDPRYREGWTERFGAWAGVRPGGVWVHGASVGEMRAVAPLLTLLRDAGEHLVLSTTSPSGRAAAAALAGSGNAARLCPLDLAPLVQRVLRRSRPRALVVVETELWPAMITEVAAAGVPLLLVNGRISDRALPRYRRVRRWIGPLLRRFHAIHVQSEQDAERFRVLGAEEERVVAAGNLKYDLPEPDPSCRATTALRRARADGWRPLVAGSTHPGEERAVAEAAEILRDGGHRVGLVVAPRHLERTGGRGPGTGPGRVALRRDGAPWRSPGGGYPAGVSGRPAAAGGHLRGARPVVRRLPTRLSSAAPWSRWGGTTCSNPSTGGW